MMLLKAYIILSTATLGYAAAQTSVAGATEATHGRSGKGKHVHKGGKGQNKRGEAVPLTCKKQTPVSWRLCNDQKDPIEFSSNLGGNGPDKQNAKEFRIKKIAQVDGITLDLVVTVATGEEYKTGSAYVSPCPPTGPHKCRRHPAPEPQRTGNCWGILPWYMHTHTKFHWKWVKSNTREVVKVAKFEITFYDVDRTRDDYGGRGPDNEYLEFNTPVASIQHGPRVEQMKLRNGNFKIQSKEVGGWQDNLAMIGKMTTIQKERGVTVSYENRGEWDITFGHDGPKGVRPHHRGIEFTGVVYACP